MAWVFPAAAVLVLFHVYYCKHFFKGHLPWGSAMYL